MNESQTTITKRRMISSVSQIINMTIYCEWGPNDYYLKSRMVSSVSQIINVTMYCAWEPNDYYLKSRMVSSSDHFLNWTTSSYTYAEERKGWNCKPSWEGSQCHCLSEARQGKVTHPQSLLTFNPLRCQMNGCCTKEQVRRFQYKFYA